MDKFIIDPENKADETQREALLLRLVIEIAIKLELAPKVEKHCDELGIEVRRLNG